MSVKEQAERRERIIVQLLAGKIANPYNMLETKQLIQWAIKITDELIVELDKVGE